MQQDTKRGLTLIAPPLGYAVALLAVPLIAIVIFSFWTQDYLTIDRTLSLRNYREALTDPIYGAIMLRSLGISGSVTLITVMLAFPVAYFVSFRVPPAHKSLWLFLITIPFWTSYLLRIFLWKVILGYNGVVNSVLTGIGLIDEPLSWILYNANAVVITLSHAFAPFAILPIFVALEKIDRSLLEASRDLGENAMTTFLRVTLPLAAPGVVAALLIVFIPTVGDYVTPAQVGGAGGTMIANVIQAQFRDLNNAPLGAALSVLAMLIVTVLALGTIWIARRLSGGRD
ncbi:Spermidine/putrescine transport system permease protein PotB [Jannaschia seosinensis]|uniref:Spermidine/putrescine transport system permease protein PotB n=1 Tax=Jannaschia seosinensis TaxID=313367 RepID=A0A0M7BD00_9RHOB|nr:ABC transporter permease [Jannaschia seosinensis]CUH40271.1 Spermidine/putrescine transport system permease protein PotB [Jannaschia seosinensis]